MRRAWPRATPTAGCVRGAYLPRAPRYSQPSVGLKRVYPPPAATCSTAPPDRSASASSSLTRNRSQPHSAVLSFSEVEPLEDVDDLPVGRPRPGPGDALAPNLGAHVARHLEPLPFELVVHRHVAREDQRVRAGLVDGREDGRHLRFRDGEHAAGPAGLRHQRYPESRERGDQAERGACRRSGRRGRAMGSPRAAATP